jgi:hypothetical protein
MQRDMPKKYWHNMPEAREIHLLLRHGQANFVQRQREVMDAEMASGAQIVCTYHSAALLRAVPAEADVLRQYLVADLRRARELAA